MASTPSCGSDIPPAPPMAPWTGWHLLDDISHLILGGLYVIVLGVSIFMRLQKTQNLRLLWQITFFIALVLGIISTSTPNTRDAPDVIQGTGIMFSFANIYFKFICH
jgi:thiol:disulfide interchange protein